MAKKTKAQKAIEKKEKAKKRFNKKKGLFAEFKAFIAKGNVLDMAIGVVIGGAFSAIVTALVNILLSVCTWGIPGGIAGLVTVLPAASDAQKGIAGIGQSFAASNIKEAVKAYAASLGQDANTSFAAFQTALEGLYTKHGGTYVYNGAAIINWGALINAFISFVIVALTLFVILKVATAVRKKADLIKAQAIEDYYKKHPELRPEPVEEEIPEPTTNDILLQIKEIIQKKD